MTDRPEKKPASVVHAGAPPFAPPPPPPASDDVFVYDLIHRCERQARGHGADLDRALLLELAGWLRGFMGLSASDPLPHLQPPAPYGPVEATLPIGHSLPPHDD